MARRTDHRQGGSGLSPIESGRGASGEGWSDRSGAVGERVGEV